MKSKFKNVLRILYSIFVICVFCFLWLKGCAYTPWTYPDAPKKYEIVGEDGRTMSKIFLPSKQTIIYYTNMANREAEAVLTRMHGSFGTHFFGSIWYVKGPRVIFGFRWVSDGGRPLMMKTTYLKKFRVGPGESRFPDVGKTTHSQVIIVDGSLKWQGLWFTKVEPDQAEIEWLLNLLEEQRNTEPEN